MKLFHSYLLICLGLALTTPNSLNAQTPIYMDPTAAVEDRVNDLLSRMTTDEKIGQMMQADLDAVENNKSVITSYFMGSIMSGGSSDPINNLPVSWADMVDTLQNRALKTRLKIPLIYGVDAVHGHSNVVGATIFPHNIGLGCTNDSLLMVEIGKITARELSATGTTWTFAPCIAVPLNEKWGRTYEGFAETAALTTKLGTPSILGLQDTTIRSNGFIAACAKHYLGDGGTLNGIDQGNTIADEATIRSIHLPAYIDAVKAGVATVMVSYSSINGTKMHGNKYWLTDVLKTELEFDGFVISDWAGVDQVNGNYQEALRLSINAGVDMVMLPNRYTDYQTAMRNLVSSGSISMDRIDDAVRRILRIKFRMGLFENPFSDRSLLPSVGSESHRAVAREAVRKSVVFLKKKDGILPLSKTSGRILVAGSHADNIGYQCGGWTIDWQGGSGETTTGTTILEGIRAAAPGATVDFSLNGSFANTQADAAIVVIGEKPYAEGQGNKTDLSLSKEDIALVEKMKATGNPVIVILVTGRPMILKTIHHQADVLMAAWLPGTEGNGIADLIFGDFPPSGKLSMTWPLSNDQIPINFGDPDYDPKFPYQFGLTSIADSPIGSAPQAGSAIVTPDGGHIELTVNKKLQNPDGVQFSITRNLVLQPGTFTANLKQGDSTTLLIETGFQTDPSDQISITLASGTIRSADGGELTSLFSFPVENYALAGAVLIPATIRAENYTSMAGIQLEASQDAGGGFHLAYIDDGDWFEYRINVPKSDYYTMKLRIAAESQAGTMQLTSDGRTVFSRTLPITGGWQSFSTVSQVAGLIAGEQTIRFTATKGGFNFNWFSIEESVSAQDEGIPGQVELIGNFPNPFNPLTHIRFELPAATMVTLTITDLSGRIVATLLNERVSGGIHSIPFRADHLSSGIYFYRLATENHQLNGKMVLIK